MLQEIFISNFILIDELRIEFAPGLNVLTGETGAGKSIIIDALGLLLGDRAHSDYSRDQDRRVVLEAVFDLAANPEAIQFLVHQDLVDEDVESQVIISREIQPGGKNTARINGRLVPISILKNFSSYLVDMHLQNDRLNILKPSRYLNYVDSFIDNGEQLLTNLFTVYHQLVNLQEQQATLTAQQKTRIQRLDFLEYQIREIEQANLVIDEDELLKEHRDRIKNAVSLAAGSEKIISLLYRADNEPSAYDQISAALSIVSNLKKDKYFADIYDPLENIYYSLEEIVSGINDFKTRLEFEPQRLEEIENRLYLIGRLKQKYGDNINAILDYLDACRQEKTQLVQIDDHQAVLEQEIAKNLAKYNHLAGELHHKRITASQKLESAVYAELKELNLPAVRFKVEIIVKSIPGPKGIDEIDFRFSSNLGEELKPVAKIASGGEISRLVLALKKALAEVFEIPTLVFDEIDVGLGGSSLNAVAKKLAGLALRHQLVLVTHSPQVASHGDRNFSIYKTVREDRTYTHVTNLDHFGKEQEIARMLDGDNYSELTLQHAREMIAEAAKIKAAN